MSMVNKFNDNFICNLTNGTVTDIFTISVSRFMTHFSVSSVTSLPTNSLPIMLQELKEEETSPSETPVTSSNFRGVCTILDNWLDLETLYGVNSCVIGHECRTIFNKK